MIHVFCVSSALKCVIPATVRKAMYKHTYTEKEERKNALNNTFHVPFSHFFACFSRKADILKIKNFSDALQDV